MADLPQTTYIIGTENGVEKRCEPWPEGMTAALAHVRSHSLGLKLCGWALAWDRDRHGWRASDGKTHLTLRAFEAVAK